MDGWLIPLLGGVGAALLGLLSTGLVQIINRPKVQAEARSTDADYGVKITASAVTLINELQDEVRALREMQKTVDQQRLAEHQELIALREEVAVLRTEVAVLKRENAALQAQLFELKAKS